MHWSPSVDLLAVALDYSVYVWVPSTGEITCLCDTDEASNYISSVRWIEQGAQLAIGSASGHVQVIKNILKSNVEHLIKQTHFLVAYNSVI